MKRQKKTLKNRKEAICNLPILTEEDKNTFLEFMTDKKQTANSTKHQDQRTKRMTSRFERVKYPV